MRVTTVGPADNALGSADAIRVSCLDRDPRVVGFDGAGLDDDPWAVREAVGAYTVAAEASCG
jgi:hypothetical protein